MSNQQLEDQPLETLVPPHAPPGEPAVGRSSAAFRDFGVLDAGKQTRSSVATSLVVNGVALLLVLLVSLTAKKIIQPVSVTTLTAPVLPPPEPKPLPPTPKIVERPPVKVEVPPPPPDTPRVEVPEPPTVQPVITKAAPTPAPTNPAPKAVTPPPAPRPVAIKHRPGSIRAEQ